MIPRPQWSSIPEFLSGSHPARDQQTSYALSVQELLDGISMLKPREPGTRFSAKREQPRLSYDTVSDECVCEQQNSRLSRRHGDTEKRRTEGVVLFSVSPCLRVSVSPCLRERPFL